MKIGMREFKAGLSRYIAQSRAGEVIVLTSYDKRVARIVGIPAVDPPGIARLVARGAAQWHGGKPALQPAVKLASRGRSLSKTLVRDRG